MIDACLRLLRVQPGAYRVLVRTFWRLSLRSPSQLFRARRGRQRSGLWKAWLMYGLLGASASFLAILPVTRVVYATFLSVSTMFLVGMAVLADFTLFVVAPDEDEILFHRPIASRTYLAARLTVAGMHVAIMAACFGAIPVLASLRWGSLVYPPLLLLSLVATGWFALLLSFGFYRLGLRLLGADRMQSVLTYLPAVFSLLVFLGPQFLLRGARFTPALLDRPSFDFLPPAWFVAIPELLLGDFSRTTLLRSALGASVLPIGVALLVLALGKGLLADLLALISGRRTSPRAERAPTRDASSARTGLTEPDEEAGYLLYVGATRTRGARARIVPVLLMPIVYSLLGLVGSMGALVSVFAVYMVAAGAGTLYAMMAIHEDHEAAWIFGALPVRHYGSFMRGMVRAMLRRHALPCFAIVSLLAIVRSPTWVTAAGCMHAFAAGCLTLPLLASILRKVPFARAPAVSDQMENMGIFLLSMLVIAFAGGVHALLVAYLPWGFFVTIPLLVLTDIVWLRAALRSLDEHPPEPIRLYAGPRRAPRPTPAHAPARLSSVRPRHGHGRRRRRR